MELFYAHPSKINTSTITLDAFESQHLLTTLRKTSGDSVDVTDGCGNHFKGTITKTKAEAIIEITSKEIIERPKQKAALAIGFIRPTRLEFALEKGTELGVSEFFLFQGTHSNYFSSNKKRFEKILRQAIKQSNRFFLPEIQLFPDFKKFLVASKNYSEKIAAIDPQYPAIDPSQKHGETLLYCVGPEGGFSDAEIQLMRENNFSFVSLGSYRLRAETAALAGLARLISI